MKEGRIIKMKDWENAEPKEVQNKHRDLLKQSQNDEEYLFRSRKNVFNVFNLS